jgi:hypothetical protein
MLLRDHPLMFRRGVRNWPPVWTWIDGRKYVETRDDRKIVEELYELARELEKLKKELSN